MSGSHRYKKPPIDEALCDFQFAPGPDWDPTMPGRLHERLKSFYKEKPRSQQLVGAQLQGGSSEGGPGLTFQQRVMNQRVQLLAENATRIASLGESQLTVHMLTPYTGWEHFRPMIVDALKAYGDVAEPEGVTRIGLRYINRIVIPGTAEPELDEYFTIPPKFPNVDANIKKLSFFNRKEAEYADLPIRIVVTFAQIETPPTEHDSHQYLLDLDIIWIDRDHPLPLDKAIEMVDEMKDRHRRVFESLIEQKTRDIFDAD